MRYVISLLLIMCSALGASGQSRSLLDSLSYRAEFQTTVGGGDHAPLWLNANKYGLSSLKTCNGYLRGAVERPLSADNGRKWGVGYGVDMALAAGFTSTFILHQAYIEGRWLKGTLTIGAKEYPMELKNQELSSGSQTFGINARPVPQIRLALPEYWSIPGLRNWLAFKGHIAYGKTTDDKWQKDFTPPETRYTEGTLYHSKAGYLKIGPKNITVELGLEMACQFGGRAYRDIRSTGDWQMVENDKDVSAFLHALIPSGSDSGEGNYGNTSGNQLGSWVVRFNLDQPSWALGVYADHFFDDHSSMFMMEYNGYGTGAEWNEKKTQKYVLYDFKDIMLGVELQLKRNHWLNRLVLEYLYSKYQSGPVYHDRTQAFSDHVGGNDNYYNHYIFTGWQHWGQVMGNPLYRSPLYQEDGQIRVGNNRMVAWHLGLSGDPTQRMHYRLLATYQTGLGTYDDPFRSPQYNLSLMGELSYAFRNGWALRGALAMDKGKLLGENYGVQLTISKMGLFKK